jgi:hypothetical protein
MSCIGKLITTKWGLGKEISTNTVINLGPNSHNFLRHEKYQRGILHIAAIFDNMKNNCENSSIKIVVKWSE